MKKKKTSPRRKWGLSQLSHMLGDDNKPCKCRFVNFKESHADWIMCPECKRVWIRNERR